MRTGAGEYRRAAELTGAHDVIDADIIQGAPNRAHFWTLLEQQARGDNRARLCELLGESEFERARDSGRELSFDEAADLALGRVRPP